LRIWNLTALCTEIPILNSGWTNRRLPRRQRKLLKSLETVKLLNKQRRQCGFGPQRCPAGHVAAGQASSLLKRSCTQAAQALSSPSSGKALTSQHPKNEGTDLLYAEAVRDRRGATVGGQTSTSGSPKPREPRGGAVRKAIRAIAQPQMEPFLKERKELNLDDNRSYKQQTQHSMDEQLFQGRLNAESTPMFHSQAICVNAVHGADSR
jgi:hypothetical protein